jgi:hypothetical protein
LLVFPLAAAVPAAVPAVSSAPVLVVSCTVAVVAAAAVTTSLIHTNLVSPHLEQDDAPFLLRQSCLHALHNTLLYGAMEGPSVYPARHSRVRSAARPLRCYNDL